MARKKPLRGAAMDSPLSGQGTSGPGLAARIFGRLRERLPYVPVFDAMKDGALEQFKETVLRHELDYVMLSGGDGSIHLWLTDILPDLVARGKAIPMIVIVPRGTMNNVARELGVVGPDPERTLRGIIDKIAAGADLDVHHRHVLRVNDLYGFVYGAGIVARLLERYYEDRRPGERLGIRRAAQVARVVLREEALAPLLARRRPSVAEPCLAGIRLRDGEKVLNVPECPYTGLLAGTITYIGMGMKPTYRAIERHNAFHLIGVREPFWRIAKSLPEVLLGLPMKGDVLDEVASEAVIEFDGDPPGRMIDGEVYPADVLSLRDVIRLGPRLRFVRS